MSINSMTNSAVARRMDFAPIRTVPKTMGDIAAAAAGMPEHDVPVDVHTESAAAKSTNSMNTAMNVLFGFVPTEVLTLYVAVLAALHKPNNFHYVPQASGKVPMAVPSGFEVTGADWISFWIFMMVTPFIVWLVYAGKLHAAQKPLPTHPKAWPSWEMGAATIAYLAWAFALPDAPFSVYGWYSAPLAAVVVLIASTVLGLLAPFFQDPLRG